MRFRRRHDVVGTVRDEPVVEGAGLGFAGNDDGIVAAFAEEALLGVESQIGLAGAGVRSMAVKARVGEDGPDIAIKRERRVGGVAGGGQTESGGEENGKFPDHGEFSIGSGDGALFRRVGSLRNVRQSV